MAHKAGIALLMLSAACGQRQPPQLRPVATERTERLIHQVIDHALQADARSERADTLYAPHAVVIADGKLRRAVPLFAGVGADGEIAITSTQLEIRGTAAWGDVEYRWLSSRSNQARVARATLVLTPAQGRQGWWIAHAHSSTGK
jgi:hypothetical protein